MCFHKVTLFDVIIINTFTTTLVNKYLLLFFPPLPTSSSFPVAILIMIFLAQHSEFSNLFSLSSYSLRSIFDCGFCFNDGVHKLNMRARHEFKSHSGLTK